jgi:hypothetical protein
VTVVGTNIITTLEQLLAHAREHGTKLFDAVVKRWRTEVYPQMNSADPGWLHDWPSLVWGFLLGAGVPGRLITLDLCRKLAANKDLATGKYL